MLFPSHSLPPSFLPCFQDGSEGGYQGDPGVAVRRAQVVPPTRMGATGHTRRRHLTPPPTHRPHWWVRQVNVPMASKDIIPSIYQVVTSMTYWTRWPPPSTAACRQTSGRGTSRSNQRLNHKQRQMPPPLTHEQNHKERPHPHPHPLPQQLPQRPAPQVLIMRK